MFIFYGVVPALIIFLWYNAIQSWQRLGITSIADIIYLLFIFIVAPIGYGYFLWKRKQPNKTRKSNLESLVNDLCNFAHSDNYICISIRFDRMPTEGYSGLYYSLGRGGAWFNFYRHGYADLGHDQKLSILRTLENRLNGYLQIYYEEIGGYDPTISVTHGITPGGGDGYYISSKGYGTANIERAAYLYLGENARKRRQADRERAKAKSKLRRL